MRIERRWWVCALLVAACGTNPPTPKDTQAPDAPTRQKGVMRPGAAALSWKNTAASDFDLTLVVRHPVGELPVRPTGMPQVGDTLGTGVVVYVGTEEHFTDSQVPAGCGPWSWALWSHDTSGLWSGGAATIEAPRGSTSQPPSMPISGFSADIRGSTVTLSWSNPSPSSGYYQTVIVRKAGTTPPAGLSDGVTISTGTLNSATDTFTSTQTWAAFTCNACGLCSTTVPSLTLRPTADDAGTDAGALFDAGVSDAGVSDGGTSTLPAPLALLSALSADGQQVQLTWVTPADPAVTRVRIVRALNAQPASATDPAATVVFEGTASNAAERVDALLPDLPNQPRRYFYRAYSCGSAGCESTGASTSLALTLKQALRGGGYTLFWRHSSASTCGDRTDLGPASTTASPGWWRTCNTDCSSSTARQLTNPDAANEMFAIGSFFRTNGITFSRMLSSEYCRAFSTAQGFNLGPIVEQRTELTYYVYDEGNRCQLSNALLNTTPTAGTNIGMVSHAGFVCPTLDSLAWGEAAIYKPQAPGAQSCTGAGSSSCQTTEGCQNGFCVRPLFIARVTAFAWAALP